MRVVLLFVTLWGFGVVFGKAEIVDVLGRVTTGAGTEPDSVLVGGQVFATGFHKIQSLAWHGRELWVSNSPDLTVVRDVDGDGTADDYTLIARSLGDEEHGLHEMAWGADGKLYLCTGDISRIPVRGFGRPMKFHKGEYSPFPYTPVPGAAHEGGVFRCDAQGNVEILERGPGNPWWLWFDDGFRVHTQERGVAAPFSPAPELSSEEKHEHPYDQWTFEELAADLGSSNAARSVTAQEELVRRGESIKVGMLKWLDRDDLTERKRTWALWTLGRAGKDDVEIEAWFAGQPRRATDLNSRVQCLRIIAYRIREFGFTTEVPPSVIEVLRDPEPLVRKEAVESLRECRQRRRVAAVVDLIAVEKNLSVLDAACRAVAELADEATLEKMRVDKRPGVQAVLEKVTAKH